MLTSSERAVCIIFRSFTHKCAHRLSRVGFDGVVIAGMVVVAVGTLCGAHYDSDIADAQWSIDASSVVPNQKHLDRLIVDKLGKDGLVVVHNVLTAAELKSARLAADLIRTEGRMQSASGNSITVRQDHVCFVRESDGTPGAVDKDSQGFAPIGAGLSHCIALLRGTAQELEKYGYSRSIHLQVPMQCQLAHYAGNGQNSYVAHRDAASDENFFQVGLLGW